jgi:hypothetical protein
MAEGENTDWAAAFDALVRYIEVRGPRRVPHSARSAGIDVGRWAEAQREAYWSGGLTTAQTERLHAVPMWGWEGPSQRRWTANLDALRRYAVDTDPAAIPENAWAGKLRIGQWVRAQRAARRRGTLPGELAEALEAVPGWVWTDEDERWQLGLAALHSWVNRHGTADVPLDGDLDGFPVGAWVQRAREDHRARTLDAERTALLDRLPGWHWTSTAVRWQRGVAMLERYARHAGHSRPPQNTVIDGFALGMWVHNRRREHRTGKLAPDRASTLEHLPGWSWSPQADASDH